MTEATELDMGHGDLMMRPYQGLSDVPLGDSFIVRQRYQRL